MCIEVNSSATIDCPSARRSRCRHAPTTSSHSQNATSRKEICSAVQAQPCAVAAAFARGVCQNQSTAHSAKLAASSVREKRA